MTIFCHEMKRGALALAIWTAAISFMLAVCVFIYPEMAGEMDQSSDMFADRGAFSDAFGMDQLNFGEFMGYFGIECGNTLGIGGALFAAILGISMLSKEEKDGTADFLFSHPVSRSRVLGEKLLSMLCSLLILNLAVVAACLLSALIVGVEVHYGKLLLMFLAYFLLQVEIAAITFGISAFLRHGGLGIGLGLALLFYFMNIASNLMEELEFLKFLTPYGYADGGSVINNGSIELKYLLTGALFTAIGLFSAFKRYTSKDLS